VRPDTQVSLFFRPTSEPPKYDANKRRFRLRGDFPKKPTQIWPSNSVALDVAFMYIVVFVSAAHAQLTKNE